MEKYRLKTKCSNEEGENDKRQPDQSLGGRSLAAYCVHIPYARGIVSPCREAGMAGSRSRIRGRWMTYMQ